MTGLRGCPAYMPELMQMIVSYNESLRLHITIISLRINLSLIIAVKRSVSEWFIVSVTTSGLSVIMTYVQRH